MAIDFSAISLEVIDINTNTTPDIYINLNSITFSRRALEEMNYPQNVQFCIDAANHIFAIKPCKSNETRAYPFSKAKAEQTTVLSMSNRNLFEIVTKLIPDYKHSVGTRYKVTGVLDMESKIMYFDMSSAVISLHQSSKK